MTLTEEGLCELFLAWEMAALAGAVRRLMIPVRQDADMGQCPRRDESARSGLTSISGKTHLRRVAIWAIL